MGSRKDRGTWGQTLLGLLLIAVGVVLVLEQQGHIEFRSLWRYWPVWMLILGVWKLTAPADARDISGGVGWFLLGLWFMACTQHWLGLTYRNSWPLIFANMGLQMILSALFPARPAGTKAEEEVHHA